MGRLGKSGLRAGSLLVFACCWTASAVGQVGQVGSGAPGASSTSSERANLFDDPFLRATSGIAACPVPEGPLITEAEMHEQAHGRTERGTSCYRAGRCRLPNSYLYDKEIVPRVKLAIESEGSFDDTSVWVLGQRRWVWLKGCVRTQAESDAMEQLVRRIDDVEGVVSELRVVPR